MSPGTWAPVPVKSSAIRSPDTVMRTRSGTGGPPTPSSSIQSSKPYAPSGMLRTAARILRSP